MLDVKKNILYISILLNEVGKKALLIGAQVVYVVV